MLTACVATGVQLREDMDKGVFDRFKVLPISRIAPLAGPMVADMLRYAIASTLTFAHRHRRSATAPAAASPAWSAAILLAIVAGWSLAWIFTWFGTIGRSAQGVQAISLMVMFPLTFLSNAFVPDRHDAAAGCRPSPTLNPVSHIISAIRDLANDGQVTAAGRLGAARLRRRRRDLRPAVGAELHPEDVRPAGTPDEASTRSASGRSSRPRRPSYSSRTAASRPGAAASARARIGSQAITGNHRL